MRMLIFLLCLLLAACELPTAGDSKQVGRYQLVLPPDQTEEPYLIDTVEGWVWRFEEPEPGSRQPGVWRPYRTPDSAPESVNQ